jgi:hypothetical protein
MTGLLASDDGGQPARSVVVWVGAGQEDEYIDGDEVVGLGTNKEGSGRLRLVASQQKVGCVQGDWGVFWKANWTA